MKILLTGASGQIGHELQKSLQGFGEIVAPERTQMNLADMAQVRDVIRSVRPTLIVNPAAYTAVDLAESEPDLAMRINAEAPAVMAEDAARLGAALVHYSSDYVFDGRKTQAYTEEDAPNPLNVYGRNKLAGEDAIRASGAAHLILRTSWVYSLYGRNFLLTVRRLAQEGKVLRIVADQFGAPTWARTVAEATALAIKALQNPAGQCDMDCWRERGGLYHLAAQGKTSWYGFARAIVDDSIPDPKPEVLAIPSTDYPTPAQRPAHSVLSSEKFIRTFAALPVWDEALKVCLDGALDV